jgi:hypothetical protein
MSVVHRWADLSLLRAVIESSALAGGQAGVRQRMALEPGPQILNRIEVRRAGWQKRQGNLPIQPIDVPPHPTRAMRLQAIPDDQERVANLLDERLEEGDDLFALDSAFVQSERGVAEAHPGNHRQLLPVEKWNGMTGVCPLGAQVRTRVGRSNKTEWPASPASGFGSPWPPECARHGRRCT